MASIDLTLRSETGVPLTATQNDQNLTTIQDAINGQDAALGVALNADGSLKDGAVSTPAKLAAGIVTLAKLFTPGVAFANQRLSVGAGGVFFLQHALSFRASKVTSNQSITGGAATAIVTLNQVDWDDSPAFASNRFVVPAGNAGKYHFDAGIEVSKDSGSPTNIEVIFHLMKSGLIVERMSQFFPTFNSFVFLKISTQLNLLDGDEVHLELQITDTGAAPYSILADSRFTYLTGHKVW